MRLTLATLFLTAGFLAAQEVTSDPIGFNKVTCLANSDTIVGIPLRKEGSLQTTLSGAPTGTGDSITLPVTATLTAGQFTKHYVKFTSGTKDGSWYDITGNATNSIIIDLNGDNLTGVVTGDSITIAEHWTLDSLFPPAGATTSWTETPAGSGIYVPNGHAVVSSVGTSPGARQTQILLPNNTSLGTNKPSTEIFYINRNTSAWVKVGGSATPPGSQVINPDSSLTIRHSSLVTRSTIFRSLGEVVLNKHTLVLATRPTGQGYNDNYVAIPRPVPVTLSNLSIYNSNPALTAFVRSEGTSPGARRDQLLVYNNGIPQINKPADTVYYYYYSTTTSTGKWVKAGDGTLQAQDTTEIPAGAGIIIRKYNTAGGVSSSWVNSPAY